MNADDKAPTPAELAAIRAENAELRRQLETQQPTKMTEQRSIKNPWWRKTIVGVLVVLAIVSVLASISAVWAQTTLQDEDQFVATLEPLPEEESVAAAISVTVADEVVQSDAFAAIWSTALRGTHKAASAVISGDGGALEAEGGVVAINLDEIAGVVVENVEAAGLEVPDVELDLGSIVLYEDEQLAAVQSLATTIDTLGWFLPLLALIFFGPPPTGFSVLLTAVIVLAVIVLAVVAVTEVLAAPKPEVREVVVVVEEDEAVEVVEVVE